MLRGDELDIRLIQKHHGVGRHPLQEALHLGGRFQGSGRVVGPTQDHHPGVRRGVGHRIQVVVTVQIQRHRHGNQLGHLGEDRIAIEGRGGEHDPVTGFGDRVQRLHHHARGTRAEHNLLVRHPDTAGDQAAQPLGQKLGVAVRRVDRGDQRRPHRRQRRERILVERQRQRIDRNGQTVEHLHRDGGGGLMSAGHTTTLPFECGKRMPPAHALSTLLSTHTLRCGFAGLSISSPPASDTTGE